MNPVVHFEMPAEDRNRMASFYTKAFGWRTQMLGEDMGNYVIATTTELDEKAWRNQWRLFPEDKRHACSISLGGYRSR